MDPGRRDGKIGRVVGIPAHRDDSLVRENGTLVGGTGRPRRERAGDRGEVGNYGYPPRRESVDQTLGERRLPWMLLELRAMSRCQQS